ncbi:uncharacterized protein [Amphiura filiformis]|uniref:uncharacterized protein n=1 Tax=Amphiura filiformis TaxID=82378 RepID=UPI003B220D71
MFAAEEPYIQPTEPTHEQPVTPVGRETKEPAYPLDVTVRTYQMNKVEPTADTAEVATSQGDLLDSVNEGSLHGSLKVYKKRTSRMTSSSGTTKIDTRKLYKSA